MNILSKIPFKQIATAFVLASFLFVTTACNSGNEVGARTDVPPVQLGGQNNPHKAGGDGMTQYRSPANDPKLEKGKDNASLPPTNLIAAANRSETTYPTDDNKVEGVLYSNDRPKSLDSVNDFVSSQKQQELLDPAEIPAKRQPTIDRSNPNNQLLEKTKQMFDDAADFSGN